MEKKGFRLFNFRFLAILLGLSCAGSYVGVAIFSRFHIFYVLLGVGVAFALLLLMLLKRKGLKYAVLIAGFLCTVLSSSLIVINAVEYAPTIQGDFVTVRVESASVDQEYVYVSVKDGLDHPPMGEGRLRLTGDFDQNIYREGSELVLSGVRIDPVYPEIMQEDEFGELVGTGVANISYFTSRAKYTITADTVESYEYNPTLTQRFRNSLSEVSRENLNEDVRGVVFALLTGDKYGINTELYRDYRVSGVAHVLAVSGLHVTFLASAITALLRKIRVKKSLQVLIILPVLLLFNFLCGFTPSVVRASVMSVVFLITPIIVRRRYDTLTSMSLSGLILITINPLTAFSYGFILSFVCVFGVLALANPISRKLRFLPDFLSSGIAMSLSATLAVLPISLAFFSEISVLGVLTNILVVPVLSLVYGVLFVVAVLCALFPVFGFLFTAVSSAIYYVNFAVNAVAGLPFVSVTLKAPVWFITGYYALGIGISDYIFLSKGVKRCLIALFILLCVVWLALQGYGIS